MSDERFGPRAIAWSEAERTAIFGHILDLEIALHTALGMLRNSAYGAHMKELLDEWRALLEAPPPDNLNLP